MNPSSLIENFEMYPSGASPVSLIVPRSTLASVSPTPPHRQSAAMIARVVLLEVVAPEVTLLRAAAAALLPFGPHLQPSPWCERGDWAGSDLVCIRAMILASRRPSACSNECVWSHWSGQLALTFTECV
jgi:hypothetical protein